MAFELQNYALHVVVMAFACKTIALEPCCTETSRSVSLVTLCTKDCKPCVCKGLSTELHKLTSHVVKNQNSLAAHHIDSNCFSHPSGNGSKWPVMDPLEAWSGVGSGVGRETVCADSFVSARVCVCMFFALMETVDSAAPCSGAVLTGHYVVWHNATATMSRSLQHRSWPKSVQGLEEESWWPVPFRRLLGHEGVIWLPPLRPSFHLSFARAGFIRFWKRFGSRPLAALVRRVAIGY